MSFRSSGDLLGYYLATARDRGAGASFPVPLAAFVPTAHGHVSAMGVALTELPRRDNPQILTAQLATKLLLDETPREHGRRHRPGSGQAQRLQIL